MPLTLQPEEPTRHTLDQLVERASQAAEHWRQFTNEQIASRGRTLPPVLVRLLDDGAPVEFRVPTDLRSAELRLKRETLMRYPRQVIGTLVPIYFAYLIAGVIADSNTRIAPALIRGVLHSMGKEAVADALELPRPRTTTD